MWHLDLGGVKSLTDNGSEKKSALIQDAFLSQYPVLPQLNGKWLFLCGVPGWCKQRRKNLKNRMPESKAIKRNSVPKIFLEWEA
ncbi:hypothetical protein [Dyadobacter sp. NIV53]|uniref:hypothetical protein n=1 Tax=Dyadobacter sp. NIV53 TaxID=2861765 RepID=UPI001C871A07|nr:hypothetical protein [Dyadobacter sp. NIV53]